MLLSAALAVVLAGPAVAQADTTRALGEVVVGEAPARRGLERIPIANILTRDPVSVADVARLIPSAAAPTNSRGQTILAIRGAGERQTAVLLDGAPLTVPWDRRIDLGLVPAGVVGALEVETLPSMAVPNTSGGALNLTPRSLEGDGALTEVEASGGLPARGRLAATHLRRRGRWGLTLSADAGARSGDALAGPLPFSQDAETLRTNTDRQSAAALARVTHTTSRTDLAVTALHVSSAQGVAPEGHLDPALESVRFWRVPEWRQTALVARARVTGRVAVLEATAWGALASEVIEAFASARYANLEDVQDDRDRSAGARAQVETAGRGITVRALGFGLVSDHHRIEGGVTDRFRAGEWRLALEAETGTTVRARVGAAWDGFAPLETAGRESLGTFQSPAVSARLDTQIRDLEVWGGVARAARFPTMRELFGGALGRFVLNPDLAPETTWQAELGASRSRPGLEARAVAFARWTDGTIEQAVLEDGRRQRVNLGGSRAFGLEAGMAAQQGSARIDASGTLMHLRAWTPEADGLRLPEQPSALGRVAASWLPASGWTAALEAVATGPAVSLGPRELIDLEAAVILGGRVGYRWTVGRGLIGVFARLDNALDAQRFPQAGLPAPGREARIGLRWIR